MFFSSAFVFQWILCLSLPNLLFIGFVTQCCYHVCGQIYESVVGDHIEAPLVMHELSEQYQADPAAVFTGTESVYDEQRAVR